MNTESHGKRFLSLPVVLFSIIGSVVGACLFWMLLEELHNRGIYNIGRYQDNRQYSDTSIWVFNGIVVFFVVLIIVVSRRNYRKG